VPFRELSDQQSGTSSAEMRELVVTARDRQLSRFQGQSTNVNGKMKAREIRKYCQLTKSAEHLLQAAMEDMGLSARAHDKILRIGRTIADLDDEEMIEEHHLSEAINFRTLDRNLWQQ
jgi:magnesium chelatase family protein